MRIYLTNNGFINRIEESGFVANSAGGANVIDVVYQGTCNMASIAFVRNDHIKIDSYLMTKITLPQTSINMFRYTIKEGDGVLGAIGPLKISVKIYNTTSDGVREIQASVIFTANVYDNISDPDDFYASNFDSIYQEISSLKTRIAELERKSNEGIT